MVISDDDFPVPPGLRHLHLHGPYLREGLPQEGQCPQGHGPGQERHGGLHQQPPLGLLNAAAQVYSKAMELDPNSDEAKNGYKDCAIKMQSGGGGGKDPEEVSGRYVI